MVTVNPVLTGESTVPVQATLSERKKREAAVGVGGNVDTGLVSLYGSFDFSHINLGNRLLSLDIDNKVGCYQSKFGQDERVWAVRLCIM